MAGAGVSIASVSGVAVLQQLLVSAQELQSQQQLDQYGPRNQQPGRPAPTSRRIRARPESRAAPLPGSGTPFSFEVKFSEPTTDKTTGVTSQEVTVTNKEPPPPPPDEPLLPPPPDEPPADEPPAEGEPPPPTFNVFNGTEGDDNPLMGTSIKDIIFANGGDDTVDGLGGNDEIYGGSGDDMLTGGEGDDVVFGDGGNDEIVAGHGGGNDSYHGGDDADTISFESTTLGGDG